jgi:pSer/pThr/pTyr-binding forkhead associated (FHA) protein
VADLALEVVEGPAAGTRIPLTGPIELGRDPELEHSLPDRQVSRRHARVEPEAGGAVLTDLGSTNGTYVNGQPIGAERSLAPGDQIRIGLTVLELRGSAEPATDRTVPRPAVTPLGDEVLQPAAPEELQDEEVTLPTGRGPLARLVDAEVKQRASVAAVTLLSASALSVILYYALR